MYPEGHHQARPMVSGYTRRAKFHQARTFSAGVAAFSTVSAAAAVE